MNTFGERLKYKRIEKGLNQEYLATKAGITQSAISQYEKGEKFPTPLVIEKLCLAMEISEQELLPQDKDLKVPTRLLRAIKGLTPKNIETLTNVAEQMKTSDPN